MHFCQDTTAAIITYSSFSQNFFYLDGLTVPVAWAKSPGQPWCNYATEPMYHCVHVLML